MAAMAWYRPLIAYAGPYRFRLVAAGSVALLGALITVLLPWPAKLAIDNVLIDQPLPQWASAVESLPGSTQMWSLVWLGLISVGLYLLRALLTGSQQIMHRTIGQQMSLDLAADVLAATQRTSMMQAAATPTGDLVRRIVFDTRSVEILVFDIGLSAFINLTTLVIMVLVTAQVNAGLAAAAFAGALPLLLVLRRYMTPMHHLSIAAADAEGQLSTAAEQSLSHIAEIQSFSAEDREQARFIELTETRYNKLLGLQRVYSGYGLVLGAFTGAATALVFLIGGLQAIDGSTTVGDLVVVTGYIGLLVGPIWGLATLTQAWNVARAGAERMGAVLFADDDLPERESPVVVPEVDGGARVVFERVTFGYEPGVAVLDGVDLVIEPGETVAFVGQTGAGKSTLASLIPRFADPWDGRIMLNGVDLRDASVKDVRELVSVVRQDPILLPVSVMANIAYGRPTADRDDIISAAADAQALEFIERMPDGFDTVLGERGATLSGGQRQRVAIARALLKDAAVLILDEPTSALDAESEAAVIAALDRVARDRTVIVIAHRLSTVRRADRIVVMDQGRIVEVGRHDELLALHGHYARYHHLQFQTPKLEDSGEKAFTYRVEKEPGPELDARSIRAPSTRSESK